MRAIITRSDLAALLRVLVLVLAPLSVWAQPPNDNPSGALSITPTIAGTCGASCSGAGTYADAYPLACTAAQGGPNCTVASATSFALAAPPCGNYQGANPNGGDVWFKFIVPATAGQNSFRLTLSSGGSGTVMTDGAMAAYLYDGTSPLTSPSAFSFIACADGGNGNMPALSLQCLLASRTYYIRVWAYGGLAASGQTFKICFQRSNNTPAPGGIPANDDPCGAYDLPVNGTCTNVALPAGVSPYTGSGPRNVFACATLGVSPNTLSDPSCVIGSTNIYRGGDVWYKVTVPANGAFTVTSSVCSATNLPNNSPTVTDLVMSLYTAGAGCSTYTSFHELVCQDNPSPARAAPDQNMPQITVKCLTPGDVIYVRCYAVLNEGFGYFNLCATSTADPVPQANDNPCGAINVPVNTCLNGSTENNASACYTLGFANPTCSSAANFTAGTTKDVWYKFVCPASGFALIDVNGGTTFKPGLALYQTPNLCSDPMGEIGCSLGFSSGFYNAGLAMGNLTPGATYYMRIWGTASSGTASNTVGTPFTVCVNSAAAAPSGYCYYLLQMIDTGSGAALGWGAGASACSTGCASAPASGTSYVDINVNGTHTYYSDPDENTFAVFQVPTAGPTLQATYNPNGNGSGAAQQFRLSVLGGGQVHPAAAGSFTQTSFSALNFCTVPPQLQQDCIGAYTICSSQPLTTSLPPGTGNVNDLNSVNRGCLSSEYGSGLWYFFRPRLPVVNGQIEMTIPSPDGGDYDWAIWRVSPSDPGRATFNCPPAGAPFRCSWAATAGRSTGMQVGAVDLSEGAGGDGFVAPITTTPADTYLYIMYVNRFATSTNMNVTLTWTVNPTDLLDCSTVLPVSFLDIAAETVDNKQVDVTWSTASEHNSAYFIVERSADNEHFYPIGEVSAMGDSQERTDYAFRDQQPKTGANYYRLQQVDMDGMTMPTVSVVALVGQNASVPVLFPNPVKDQLYAAMEIPVDGPVVMKVMDALGRVVSTRKVALEKGLRTLDFSMNGLAPGSYTFNASTEEGAPIGTARFMKE